MPAEVIDLFCGVGGLTCGLLQSGLNVVAGFDNDATCEYAYTTNNHVNFHLKNIREVTGLDLLNCYAEGTHHILVGCAPCQPFSAMRFKLGDRNTSDDKYNLLSEFGRLIEESHPMVVSMENVPQIQESVVYADFIALLTRLGYYIDARVVFCPDYGISQSRRRFVLLASTLGEIHLIPPTHDRTQVFVRNFINNLPPIAAGEACETDPLHRSARLSDLNLKRIQASVPGGSWKDWPTELRCKCHQKESGKSYGSVYGRMKWDQIGPTITTQFYCYGTGRYGHPDQHRALSLREGALLQTFPQEYDFIDPDQRFSFRDIARHIGNAVPVRLGEVIGISINNHLLENGID